MLVSFMSSAFFVCTGSENLKDICYKLARISKKSVLRGRSDFLHSQLPRSNIAAKNIFFLFFSLSWISSFPIWIIELKEFFHLLFSIKFVLNSFWINWERKEWKKKKKNVSAMHIESSSHSITVSLNVIQIPL